MGADEREVFDAVVAMVLAMAPEQPSPSVDPATANFVDELGYHSVALVEPGFAVEERFELDPITAEDVEDVTTAKDLARFVVSRLALQPDSSA